MPMNPGAHRMGLSTAQIDPRNRDGFLVIPDAIDLDRCRALRRSGASPARQSADVRLDSSAASRVRAMIAVAVSTRRTWLLRL